MANQSTFTISEPEPGLFSFTCWNPTHTGCGVFSVRGEEARDRNIKALEEGGSVLTETFYRGIRGLMP